MIGCYVIPELPHTKPLTHPFVRADKGPDMEDKLRYCSRTQALSGPAGRPVGEQHYSYL